METEIERLFPRVVRLMQAKRNDHYYGHSPYELNQVLKALFKGIRPNEQINISLTASMLLDSRLDLYPHLILHPSTQEASKRSPMELIINGAPTKTEFDKLSRLDANKKMIREYNPDLNPIILAGDSYMIFAPLKRNKGNYLFRFGFNNPDDAETVGRIYSETREKAEALQPKPGFLERWLEKTR
jgi:hypothetical protein